MNETNTLMPKGHAEAARALAQALGADHAALSDAMFGVLDRLGMLLSVKEVDTGRYVYANAHKAALFGLLPSDLLGSTDSQLMDAAQASTIRAAEQVSLAHPAPMPSEYRIEKDGGKREFSVTRIAVLRADRAAPRHLLSVWIESTEEHRRASQLQQALAQIEQQQIASEMQRREMQDQTLRDGTTGLYQRQHFDDQLRRELDLSAREHREFALVSIAIDPFSEAVLAMGAAGRLRVLESLGALLRNNTRAMDASCRLDEDRFAVLLSGVGLATAHSRMEGFRRQCAKHIVVLEGRDLGFTVSMGVASFPHTSNTEDDLQGAADHALSEAQKRGGNHVALASIRFKSGSS